MKIKLIKTAEDYKQSVMLLEAIGDSEDFGENQEQLDDFELLSELISFYEEKNFPIKKANPLEVIKMKMDYLGLKRKDFLDIASSGVLSEVFSGKRGLSKRLIRGFSERLGISQDLLNPLEETGNKSLTEMEDKALKSYIPEFEYLKEDAKMVDIFKKRTCKESTLFNIGFCYS